MEFPRIKTSLIALSFLAFAIAMTAHTQDFESVKRLAASGDATAQWFLGTMHAAGQGVSVNDAEAVKWYRKAAEQGDANAQLNLGVAYFEGIGVPESNILAHKWLNLARVGGDEKAGYNLEVLIPRMTKEQIAEAQKPATEWHEAHQGE